MPFKAYLLVCLLKAFGLLGTISLHHAHHKRAKATTSCAYKRPPIEIMHVAALYQAIAFYDYHSEYQLCIEALYLASPDYVAGNPIASAKYLEVWYLSLHKE